MKYIDLHCDTLTELKQGETLRYNQKSVSLQGLIEGNVLVQCCSMFIPTGTFQPEERNAGIDREVERIYGNYQREISENADRLLPILRYQDILQAEKEKKTGILLTIEDGGVLKGQMNLLQQMYERGVRLITLTWNHENEIGYPHSSDVTMMNCGLKPKGLELVERMQEIGIIVDVSHLSDGGFYDVASCSKKMCKPFVASHSNARRVAGHTRNMTDDMIRTLADCGGVMGLNFCPAFLDDKQSLKGASRIEDMVRHVQYIRNVGGSEVIAIGSDFDGIEGKLEISGPENMWRLWDALKESGISENELDCIAYKNAARVMKDTL